MNRFIAGWSVILRILWALLKGLLSIFEFLLELALGRKEQGKPVDCFNQPDVRARPDPYIYSQQWLHLRGIGYTWDNPDFTIREKDTGAVVDNHHLIAHVTYRVQATIHNSSIMAAVNTTVFFEVLKFGAGTVTMEKLSSAVVNVPALGTAVAETLWTTPDSAGHNCLRAIIVHPDDANPLNNIGQHNTDVAEPASPERRLKFFVGNQSQQEHTFVLTMNSYRLPEHPLRPGPADGATGRAAADGSLNRRSPEYLRRLRELNDFARFPVPAFLDAKLEFSQLTLKAGQEVETFVEMLPPKAGQGTQHVNVNVMLDGMLVGGVTAYVEEA